MSLFGNMRQGLRNYVVPVVSTVMLLLGIGLYIEGNAKHAQHDAVTYQWEWLDRVPIGAKLPAASLQLSDGTKRLNELTTGNWTLVVLSSRFAHDLLDYPETLVQRFGADRLNVVNVLYPSPENELAASRHPVKPGVTMAIDHRRELAEHLGLPEAPPPGRTGLVWHLLLDPDGALRFSYPKPVAADAMRQIAERLIDGAPPYVVDPKHDAYLPGRTVPVFQVERIGSGDSAVAFRNIAPGAATLIFLRAHCATCGMDSLVRQVERAHMMFGSSATPLVTVFSSAYNVEDLALRTRHLKAPLYRATSLVPAWEDPYASRFSDATAAMVVDIAADGAIARSDDFQNWLALLAQARPSKPSTAAPVDAARAGDIAGWTRLADGTGLVLSFVRGAHSIADGRLALLDGRDHRLIVVGRDGRVVEAAGIGQGPADVFLPMAFAIHANTAYVIDQDGAVLHQLPIGPGGATSIVRMPNLADSIAVLPDGSVYINSPRDEAVAVKISRSGEIEQRVGRLLEVRDGYPGKANSASLRVPLSRAWLAPAGADRLVAAFQFSPVVRMYSRAGALLWETRLTDGIRPVLEATFWGEAGAPAATSVKSIDGVQFPVVLRSVAVDGDGRVYVVAGDGRLRVLDVTGNVIRTIDPAHLPFRGSIDAMTVTPDQSLVVCSRRSCFQQPLSVLMAGRPTT